MPSSSSKKTATAERVVLPGQKRASVVYVGAKGGKYVRKSGRYVALRDAMATGRRMVGGDNANVEGMRKAAKALPTLTINNSNILAVSAPQSTRDRANAPMGIRHSFHGTGPIRNTLKPLTPWVRS
jgi:hypothetical protein